MSFPTTHPALSSALATRGYSVPTAVQMAVLGEGTANRDLLVSAQTGSGKTVAFGLAFGQTLLGEEARLGRAGAPLALIIAPTRELAMQVSRELTWLYEATGACVVACVGGMDARAEARQLQAGAHIVVGTPGRLRDHIERRRLDLGELRVAVLDEADEMLDLGFREDLEFILDATPAERRTMLFSATVPREIETLARRYQSDAVRIETLRRDEQHADIDYLAHRVAPQDIENAVVNVLRLHEARAALVFCSTREAVNRFSARLIERGFSAVALSGEFTQQERTRALQSLRDGRARVLVATDVAARGLDLPDLALVIHADLPNDAETLLHRSGRTGRAGRKGHCVLIVPFNRRRKADALIGAARLKVTWAAAPTPEEIRVRDQDRFVADGGFTAAPSEDELKRAKALQAARSADEIALALVRLHYARMPAPEELLGDAGPPRREWAGREDGKSGNRNGFDGSGMRAERGIREPGKFKSRYDDSKPRSPNRRFDDGREMVWFRINIGRERNADPRWLLPLICRAGGVTKSEIGAIRIDETDTRFQIAAEFADQFDHTSRTAKKKEGHIVRVDGNSTDDQAKAAVAGTPEAELPDKPSGASRSAHTKEHAAVTRIGAKKAGNKPRWRDQGKTHRAKPHRGKAPRSETEQSGDAASLKNPSNGVKPQGDGWGPRRRNEKVAGTKGHVAGAARSDDGSGSKSPKFAKKKQRHRVASKT